MTGPLDLAPSPSSNPQKAVLALVSEVQRLLALTRAMIASGRCTSLAGLDSAVGLVCAKALDLPIEQSRPVRAELILLAAELDRLAAVVRAEPPAATVRCS